MPLRPFRARRFVIAAASFIVLVMTILSGYVLTTWRENSRRHQSDDELENHIRVAEKQSEKWRHLYRAVHETTRKLGIASNIVVRRTEDVLANRIQAGDREIFRLELQATGQVDPSPAPSTESATARQ